MQHIRALLKTVQELYHHDQISKISINQLSINNFFLASQKIISKSWKHTAVSQTIMEC